MRPKAREVLHVLREAEHRAFGVEFVENPDQAPLAFATAFDLEGKRLWRRIHRAGLSWGSWYFWLCFNKDLAHRALPGGNGDHASMDRRARNCIPEIDRMSHYPVRSARASLSLVGSIFVAGLAAMADAGGGEEGGARPALPASRPFHLSFTQGLPPQTDRVFKIAAEHAGLMTLHFDSGVKLPRKRDSGE